jgi:hypothetical protein
LNHSRHLLNVLWSDSVAVQVYIVSKPDLDLVYHVNVKDLTEPFIDSNYQCEWYQRTSSMRDSVLGRKSKFKPHPCPWTQCNPNTLTAISLCIARPHPNSWNQSNPKAPTAIDLCIPRAGSGIVATSLTCSAHRQRRSPCPREMVEATLPCRWT